MNIDQYYVLGVILLFSIFDSMRDYYVSRKCSWWKWHTFKWLSTYPILAYISITNFELWQCAIIALCSWLIWHLTVKIIFGEKFDSWIITLIKTIILWLFTRNYYNGNE